MRDRTESPSTHCNGQNFKSQYQVLTRTELLDTQMSPVRRETVQPPRKTARHCLIKSSNLMMPLLDTYPRKRKQIFTRMTCTQMFIKSVIYNSAHVYTHTHTNKQIPLETTKCSSRVSRSTTFWYVHARNATQQ